MTSPGAARTGKRLSHGESRGGPDDHMWPLAMAVVIVLQLTQVFTRPINWDEFWHFTHIAQLQAGMPLPVIQYFHARALGWVTALPGTPIDQIIVIRLVMLGCELIAAAAIAGIAMRFVDRTTARLCALAYLSFTYVFQFGFSFRFDPPLAAVLMSLMWLVLRSRLDFRAIAIAAVLIALLPMISMKAVLYAPAVAAVAWLRWADEGFAREFLVRMAGLAVAATAIFIAFYLILAGGEIAAGSGNIASAPASVFHFLDNPNWTRLVRAATGNPLVTALILAFPLLLARSQRSLHEKIALAGLYLPLFTPAIYVNTAPYFFVFMLPPVLVACAISMEAARSLVNAKILALVFVLMVGVTLITQPSSVLANQRDLRAAVVESLGEDVRYIDFPGVMGTPHKANTFLSPLAVDIYRKADERLIVPAMTEEPVPLLIVNNFILEAVMDGDNPAYLHEDDRAALFGNYIQFWGPLWIAGREVHAGETIRYDNLVPGTFTAIGGDIEVDGNLVNEGETITLARASYRLRTSASTARLVWGEGIMPPDRAPPDQTELWELF